MRSPAIKVCVLAVLLSAVAADSAFSWDKLPGKTFSENAYQLSSADVRIAENAFVGNENKEEQAASGPEEDDSFLPFFGKEARQRGYELPLPFGINVNYMDIHQNINVQSISFEGLSLNLPDITIKVPLGNTGIKIPIKILEEGVYPIPSDIFKIGVKSTRQKNKTETLRLDAWVFPFMNVYGVVGHTKGSSVSKISVGSDVQFIDQIMKALGPMDNLDFVLKFKGTTYGLGTTLAGGVGNWFALADFNYTKTKLNIIEGNIKAFTFSPRVGYRFSLPAVDAIKMPEGKLSLWVGSMYQNVQQDFKGNLSNLKFSAGLQKIIGAVNWNGQADFHVKQRLESPWNMLVGARWEIGKHFNLLTEVGFIKRNSFFAAAEYRF